MNKNRALIKKESFDFTKNNFSKLFFIFIPLILIYLLTSVSVSINTNTIYISSNLFSFINSILSEIIISYIIFITINNSLVGSFTSPYKMLNFKKIIKIIGLSLLISFIIFLSVFFITLIIGIICGFILALSNSSISILLILFLGLGYLILIINIIYRFRFALLLLINDINLDIETLNYREYISLSNKLMKNNIFETFIFDISFILWYMLCVFILPIIWVLPYIKVSQANYFIYIVSKSEEFNIKTN